MDEEENPRGGARGEAGNSTPDDGGADADADAGTDTDDTPSNDASGGDGSADSSAVEDDVSPEDIDIQASIGPDADAPDASDEDLDQHKDPDVGLDKVVLNDDEGSKGLFDDLLAGEPIFENKEVLRPSYTPHELPVGRRPVEDTRARHPHRTTVIRPRRVGEHVAPPKRVPRSRVSRTLLRFPEFDRPSSLAACPGVKPRFRAEGATGGRRRTSRRR